MTLYSDKIMTRLLGEDRNQSWYSASSYYTLGDKMVRVSDHLPKVYNLEANNEGIKEMFLVFTSNISDIEIEKCVEEIENKLGVSVQTWTIEDESEIEIASSVVKRFLNS